MNINNGDSARVTSVRVQPERVFSFQEEGRTKWQQNCLDSKDRSLKKKKVRGEACGAIKDGMSALCCSFRFQNHRNLLPSLFLYLCMCVCASTRNQSALKVLGQPLGSAYDSVFWVQGSAPWITPLRLRLKPRVD